MINKAKEKLRLIGDIWSNFIYENKFCQNQINFDINSSSNYFGDIIGYYFDTFDIIFDKKNSANHSENFASHISFFQAIYIQQDFVEEMLILFKTGIQKGTLKLDPNYSINRDIRNELVGHPISRTKDGISSSTVFGYERSSKHITYLRYRADNNFKAEIIKVEINEIIHRHTIFLNTYFDIIIESLKSVLENYSNELTILNGFINQLPFQSLLKIVSQKLNSFLESAYLYDEKSMLEIYSKKNEHRRYLLVYDSFLKDLENQISGLKEQCISIFNEDVSLPVKVEVPLFDDLDNFIPIKIKATPDKTDYHYELTKLPEKRSPMDFEFFSGLIRAKCSDEIVLGELDRMEDHLDNDIEYLSSYKLIRAILKDE